MILTNQNKMLDESILLNGDNMQNEITKNKKQPSVTVEYGNEDLKELLSDYLKQKFLETLKEE